MRAAKDLETKRALEEKVQNGELERLPSWQRDLLDLHRKLGGDGWKEAVGWPTEEYVAAGTVGTGDMYGVTRPFQRPTEVSALDLAWNGLSGDFSSLDGIWKMQGLEILHLGVNR